MAIINPYRDRERLVTVPGTRMLQESFGLVGCSFEDPKVTSRLWTIVGVYAPIYGRALSGVRARLVDTKGFISFVNQQDLELLLGLAKPGQYCQWLDRYYPGMNDTTEGWIGLMADTVDLIDDLYERELALREQHGWGVLPALELVRRVHVTDTRDVERIDVLLWDADPDTGLGPDPSLETMQRRWVCSQEEVVNWTRQ